MSLFSSPFLLHVGLFVFHSIFVLLFLLGIWVSFSPLFPYASSRLPLPVEQLPSLGSIIPFFISPSACVICFFSPLPSPFHCPAPVSRHAIIGPVPFLPFLWLSLLLFSSPSLYYLFPFPSYVSPDRSQLTHCLRGAR